MFSPVHLVNSLHVGFNDVGLHGVKPINVFEGNYNSAQNTYMPLA